MDEKTILITGCSSGIGLDAARTMAARGWRVFAACRQECDAARMSEIGATGVKLDYEETESVAGAVDAVLSATHGRLDALFNNGAFALPAPVEDISRAGMSATMNANFLGWHDLTVRLLPAMRAQGHGRIVNCSSVLGFVTTPYRGAYSASKYAVEAWSDALRMEMADLNIHVSLIQPGSIETEFRRNAMKRFEQWIDWENSPRVDQYHDELLEVLRKGSASNPFRKPPAAVTKKLIHAVESRKPKARYMVTTPTYGVNLLRRLLPTSALDKVLTRG